MTKTKKEYIGDSVYVDAKHGTIVLTTENGYQDDPSNVIYLEPAVLAAFQDYVARLKVDVDPDPLAGTP